MRKNTIIFTIVLVAGSIVLLVILAGLKDKNVMKVEYCWNSVGDHFVAPDARCQ